MLNPLVNKAFSILVENIGKVLTTSVIISFFAFCLITMIGNTVEVKGAIKLPEIEFIGSTSGPSTNEVIYLTSSYLKKSELMEEKNINSNSISTFKSSLMLKQLEKNMISFRFKVNSSEDEKKLFQILLTTINQAYANHVDLLHSKNMKNIHFLELQIKDLNIYLSELVNLKKTLTPENSNYLTVVIEISNINEKLLKLKKEKEFIVFVAELSNSGATLVGDKSVSDSNHFFSKILILTFIFGVFMSWMYFLVKDPAWNFE